MQYEAQEMIQETTSTRTESMSNLFQEAYSVLSQTSGAAERAVESATGSNNSALLHDFGAIELFDSSKSTAGQLENARYNAQTDNVSFGDLVDSLTCGKRSTNRILRKGSQKCHH